MTKDAETFIEHILECVEGKLKFVAFSFVLLILLVDNALAQEKTPLENISLIVSIVVGIATIAGVIIAYLTYKLNKKKKSEKQLEEQKIIVGSESTTIENSKIEKQEAGRDSYKAGRDIILQQPSETEPLTFPSPPSLHNQTPPEPNFVGREKMLETITDWYTNPEVRIGALIGWGGVGKSAIVRKWYDTRDLFRKNMPPTFLDNLRDVLPL